ncbi:MAG TPA: tetratricopeptide repeat protein, partial [Eudoraea sp.]|nr:tetratricopeptide repeat protein [Eudoraea sp.]
YEASLLTLKTALDISEKENPGVLTGKVHIAIGEVKKILGRYTGAKKAIEKGIDILQRLDNDEALARGYLEYGRMEGVLNNHDTSLEYYDKSLQIYERLEDRRNISNLYYRIAVHYDDIKDEEKSLEYFTKGRAIKEAIGDTRGLAKFNLSLGVLHEEKGNFEIALEYYRQSLKGYEYGKDRSSMARVFNNIGVAYIDWNKYDSAQVYLKRSVDLHRLLRAPIGLIRSLANLGEVYQYEKKYDLAIQNFMEAKTLSEATEAQPMLGMVSNSLGQTYLSVNQLDSASFYLNKSLRLRLDNNNYFSLRHNYKNLSVLEEKKGNFRKSLEYYKLHKEVADSLFQTRKDKELAEIQAKYDTEKQEKEIIGLQQENEKRTLWRNIFAVGTLGALAIALLIFQFFMYRNKKNKQLLIAEETQRRELEKLDQLKSRFFNNISHEFRTPLTLILGPLEKIRKSVDDHLQPTVDIIERNGKRLLKLINQLLDLSKIESGKVVLKTSLTDLIPLLKGWVISFSSLADTKNIELTFTPEKESYFLYVDREKIEEVIINLMSNAFKYTPTAGRISVRVAEKKAGGHNYLSIAVSDTGTGISAEELDHIFDRFYQASNADAEDVTGTGIGLALIKELVELHKGFVNVMSEVAKGTTFEVLLPMGKDHLNDEEIVRISRVKETSGVEEEPRTTAKVPALNEDEPDDAFPVVLLIEDNQDLRMYIREILSESYKVLEAAQGEEGVAMAREHIPDIVLSDLMMPKLDGLEVCRLLKEDMLTSHIPIILITAKSSREDKLEGLKSLADDYLTKPFDTEELLVRLRNLIDLRKKMQSYFSSGDILLPRKIQLNSMDSIFMEKVTGHLEAEISNSLFGVVELAYAVGLSRSQLFRKIKAITNLTPNEFMRSFRLHRAMDILKQQGGSVSEVAYETGFQNPSYFSKCFQEQFGQSPSAVLRE